MDKGVDIDMILNQEYLREQISLAHSQYANERSAILNENAAIFAKRKKYDVFLSHSYLDKELVYKLVEIFNEAGYSVYVDWMIDKQLDRSQVDAETAQTLRERMKDCKGLAYVATSNITLSKWCPWELGYVDGNKNGRCAILPNIKNNGDAFKGQEYLGLYPYIDYETTRQTGKYDFWVNDPKEVNKYKRLRAWLDGEDL